MPTGPIVSVDPRTGRLGTRDTSNNAAGVSQTDCWRDRMELANYDDEDAFRDLLDDANAANASFYPVDPRGLAVFDTPIMRPDVPGSPPISAARSGDAATDRSLRTLADATDGLAVVNSNDLGGAVSSASSTTCQHLLPDRLLLERQAGWKVPSDHRSA